VTRIRGAVPAYLDIRRFKVASGSSFSAEDVAAALILTAWHKCIRNPVLERKAFIRASEDAAQ